MDSSTLEYTESESDSNNLKTVDTTARKYKCTYQNCSTVFMKSRKLINHLRRHTGERPFICTETGCTKSYTNSSHLLRHKRSSHNAIKTVKVPCPVCDKLFASSCHVKKHRSRFHNEDRKYPYTCSECKKGFFRKKFLQQHMYEHTGKMPFSCDYCDSSFMCELLLNRHKRFHRMYKCSYCDESFVFWSMLVKHRRICEHKVFTCADCGKIFDNKNHLRLHIEKHANDIKNIQFVCHFEGCERSYKYKRNLNMHLNRAHTQIQSLPRLSCEVEACNVKFAKMQNLKVHMMAVHGESRQAKFPKAKRKDVGLPRSSVIHEIIVPSTTKENLQEIL